MEMPPKRTLDRLIAQSDPGRDLLVWDAAVPGLVLRLRSWSPRFAFQYKRRGRTRRVTIGADGPLTLDHLSVFSRVLVATTLFMVTILTAGCYFYVRAADSGSGEVCVGFGCPGEPRRQPGLRMSFSDFTRFEHSVKPAVDNFLSRYRSSPNDPQLKLWMDYFFAPAKRLLGEEFEFDPTVSIVVEPSKSSLTATVSQPDFKDATEADAAFRRFLPLVQRTSGHQEILLGWRIDAKTTITAVNENTIRYKTTIELWLSRGTPGHAQIVRDENAAFKSFANRLHQSLRNAYLALFKEYGLTITSLK